MVQFPIHRKILAVVAVFAVLDVLRSSANAQLQASSDFDIMTSNVRAYQLATSAAGAESPIASMKSDGSWSDINYSEVPSGTWSVGNHYSRIYAMTLAYNIPTYFRYQQESLLTSITLALDYGQKHVAYVDCPTTSGNWWWWEIGVPNNLGPTLFLMQGFVNPTIFTASRDALAYLIKPAPHMTGENHIWSATNHMYLGLIDRDASRMTLVKQAIEHECAVQSGANDGIKEEGSFYQHGAQLYNGGYGRGFGEDVSCYLLFANNSSYQVTTQSVEALAAYILDGSRWMIYGNYYEISCRGREFTRGDQGQMTVPNSLLVLGNVANSRRNDAICAAKRFMQVKSGYNSRLASQAQAIQASPLPPFELTGHKHFYKTDFTIHRRANYFLSLKMFSTRVISAELVNNEGKKSWHESDGATWLQTNYNDYNISNTYATLDWNRVPGTSVERKTLSAGQGYGKGTRTLVGGTCLGAYGVSAMDLAANATTMSAKKSWFFFDDEIVCIGTDVRCPSSNTAETIVNQRVLPSASTPLWLSDGTSKTALAWNALLNGLQWAQCDNIGYYFPGSPTIRGIRQTQTGTWSSLNVSGSTSSKSNPVLTLLFDHGVNPQGAKYAYALLPGKSSAQTAAYSAAPPFAILAQTSAVHALRHSTAGALGAVFWQAGTVDKVTVDYPCIVFLQESATTLSLSLSEPTQATKTIHVTITGRLIPRQLPSGASCNAQKTKAILTLPVTGGHNYIAQFDKYVPSRYIRIY